MPQMTLEQPGLGELLHEPPVARQHAGVVDADALPQQLRQRLAEAGARTGRRRAARRARAAASARYHACSSEVACSTASSWVKCTTYTGAWRVVTSSSSVSASGVTAQVKVSGTGRSASVDDAVSRPVRRVRSAARSDRSPSVADISRNWACGSSSSGTCQAQPRSGLGVEVELVHHDQPDVGGRPSRSAMLARISAVQQMIGASAFTEASPVSMPTSSAPKTSHSVEELLAHQRLDRGGVEGDPVAGARAAECAATATSDLPEPVGVARMTLRPAEQLDHGLVLVRVELQPLRGRPVEDGVVHVVRAVPLMRRGSVTYDASRRDAVTGNLSAVTRGPGARWRTPRAGCRR